MFDLLEKIVIFDTEFTTWEGAMERGWSGPNEHREIVQIGALLAETENFTELDSFNVFVKPKINPKLSEFFIELTGIAQEMVDDKGIDFKDALEKFHRFARDYPLYSWGGTGDPAVIRENCEMNSIAFPFEEARFFSSSAVFETRGVSTEGYTSGTIVKALGKEVHQRGHNALNDVRTTLEGLKQLKKATV